MPPSCCVPDYFKKGCFDEDGSKVSFYQFPEEVKWIHAIRTGLKITVGQRTMSGLIADLMDQTLILPVILTGHFWIQTFYFPYSCLLMLYNAVLISFSLAFFAALH